MVRDNESRERADDIPSIDSRRRKLLTAIGTSGIVGLAGCMGGETDENTPGGTTSSETTAIGDQNITTTTDSQKTTATTDGSQPTTTQDEAPSFVDNATLTSYVTKIPSNVNWADPIEWPPHFFSLTTDVMATTTENEEMVPMVATEWEHSDTEVRFKIRDDASWSNGKPLLAKDYLAELYRARFTSTGDPTLEELQRMDGPPEDTWDAVTHMSWDGKEGRIHSKGGWFAQKDMEDYVEGILTGDWGEVLTHRWSQTGKAMVEAHRRCEEAEVLPSSAKGREIVRSVFNSYRTTSRGREGPSAVVDRVVSGAWEPAEITETEIILKPNESHYSADQINWDRIKLHIQPQARQHWVSLKEEIVDATSGTTGLPAAHIIDTFPDYIQAHQYGGDTKTCLYAPATREYLGRPKVRQALLMAIQKDRVAETKHKYAAKRLQQPPGLTGPGAQEFIDNNNDLRRSFQTYGYDSERATSLMKEEGFTKNNGSWVTPDGNEWRLTLTVPADTLQVDQVVMSALEDFGIPIELETLEGTTFENRFNDGDFQLTIRDNVYYPADGEMYYKALVEEARRKRLGLWKNERVLEWVKNNENINRKDYDWTYLINGERAQQYNQFTVSAPPLGKPESEERIDYPVAYMQSPPPGIDQATIREYMQKLMWVWNWTLPLMPLCQVQSIAFMNHRDWIAPKDDAQWQLGYPNPLSNLMNMGKIHADPER